MDPFYTRHGPSTPRSFDKPEVLRTASTPSRIFPQVVETRGRSLSAAGLPLSPRPQERYMSPLGNPSVSSRSSNTFAEFEPRNYSSSQESAGNWDRLSYEKKPPSLSYSEIEPGDNESSSEMTHAHQKPRPKGSSQRSSSQGNGADNWAAYQTFRPYERGPWREITTHADGKPGKSNNSARNTSHGKAITSRVMSFLRRTSDSEQQANKRSDKKSEKSSEKKEKKEKNRGAHYDVDRMEDLHWTEM